MATSGCSHHSVGAFYLGQKAPENVPLNPQGGDPGIERLSVYSEGYKARIRESLNEVYEAIEHLLGHDVFCNLAQDYAKHYASQNYNLNVAGYHMPEFLASHKLTKDFPFLPDLATLEWSIAKAFHAFAKPVFDPGVLAKLPPEEWDAIRISFQPFVHLVSSQWPVLDIWKSRNVPVKEIKIELENRPQNVLVARREADVFCDLIDRNQYTVLAGLLEGKPLGDVCAEIVTALGDEPLPLAQWFTQWVSQALIATCKISHPQHDA